jgi:hypothetical protein
MFGLRPRDKGVLVDLKGERPELPLPREIGYGHTARPFRDQFPIADLDRIADHIVLGGIETGTVGRQHVAQQYLRVEPGGVGPIEPPLGLG